MVNLGIFVLTWLLQAVIHWFLMFSYCKWALPECQELAVSGGDQEEDAVTNLELLGPGRMVVEVALLSLGGEQVLAQDGGHLVCVPASPLCAQLWSGKGMATLPKEAFGPSPKQELKGHEARLCLRSLMNCKQDVQEKEVPVLATLIHDVPQHLLQGLVESLSQPIHLGVVHIAVELFHLQHIRHGFCYEGCALVGE